MAATTSTSSGTEVQAQRLSGPPSGWFMAPMVACGAVLLAVVVTAIFAMVLRSLAPVPGGHRTQTQIVVPHPAPGPFGS